MYCDAEGKKTLCGVKAMTVKERVSLMMAISAGGKKVPLFMVRKSKKPHCFLCVNVISHQWHTAIRRMHGLTREWPSSGYCKSFIHGIRRITGRMNIVSLFMTIFLGNSLGAQNESCPTSTFCIYLQTWRQTTSHATWASSWYWKLDTRYLSYPNTLQYSTPLVDMKRPRGNDICSNLDIRGDDIRCNVNPQWCMEQWW